jgi:hypothetical protein
MQKVIKVLTLSLIGIAASIPNEWLYSGADGLGYMRVIRFRSVLVDAFFLLCLFINNAKQCTLIIEVNSICISVLLSRDNFNRAIIGKSN